MLPIVALIGRPNTGKSTLFNRIVRKRHAITASEAGTTRDRVYMHANICDQTIILVDTGGLNFDNDKTFDSEIEEQTLLAMNEADVIMLTIDSSCPLTKSDHQTVELLRKTKKPVIVIANKSDHSASQENLTTLFKLGFDKPIAVSAIHNRGISELEGELAKHLPKDGAKIPKSNRLKIGFVGKPNAGKSSLVNKILGKDQVIVSDVSGTTRDSTHLDFDYEDSKFTLVDTAGIRRRGKQRGIERFGVMRTLRTIEEIDTAVLVIDGTDSLVKQDMHVAEFILEATRGMIIVVNKSDKLKPEQKNRVLGLLKHRMQFAPWAPVVFTSALTGTNVSKILDLALEIEEERKKRINTSTFNYFIKKTTIQHPPQSHSPHKPKVQYATQVETNPPTFVFFCKHVDNLHFSYKRYLENRIREEYGFTGTAIKLSFKSPGRNSHYDKD